MQGRKIVAEMTMRTCKSYPGPLWTDESFSKQVKHVKFGAVNDICG